MMRLTLRCLIAVMRAVENQLEQVVYQLRQDSDQKKTPSNGVPFYTTVELVRKHQKETNRYLSMVLDEMLDSGYGG